MVYTANRIVERIEKANLCEAVCLECGWYTDDPLHTRNMAVEHVRKMKHKVKVEIKNLSHYQLQERGY